MTSDIAERPLRYWSPWLGAFAVAWVAAFLALADDPAAWIAHGWIFVPVGFAGAVLGNISAVGGGIVFIPVFVLGFDLPPVQALKVALATQCFGMTSGAIGWLRRRAVPIEALAIAIPGLLIGSSISTFVIHPSALLVRLLFGPVSIGLGLLVLLLDRPGPGRRDLPQEARAPLFGIALIGGMITGWVAIGEGELVAAMLMITYGMEAATAIALGVVLLSVNSIFLVAAHQLALGGIPWHIALFTGLGAVFGARFAPWVARHTDSRTLKRIFATIAIADGCLFVAQFIRASLR